MRIIAMTDREWEKLYEAIVSQMVGNKEPQVNPTRRLLDLIEKAYSVTEERYQRWLDTA
ncbi:MAG: hypothetical protein HXS54_06160 [Theionarchaea archaeon]|nr:hypothetical protein [Theionarchaea archaeon]DBA34842.1 TPA_asm: hypothetical protein vir521_00048 [Caudoviricetes sp. vir521]